MRLISAAFGLLRPTQGPFGSSGVANRAGLSQSTSRVARTPEIGYVSAGRQRQSGEETILRLEKLWANGCPPPITSAQNEGSLMEAKSGAFGFDRQDRIPEDLNADAD